MRHVIRKQVIDLNTTNAAAAFRMQQDAAKYYQQEICPLLEKIFDELAPADQYILLDHIEIDLGWVLHDPGKGFLSKENIEKKLRTQLQEIVSAAQPVSAFVTSLPGEKTGLKKPAALHALDQWLHYMRHGLLPWHAGETGDGWNTKVLEALATDYHAKRVLAQQLLHTPIIGTRIIRRHDAVFLVRLIEAVTAVKQSGLPVLISKLVEAIPINNKQKLEEKIWSGVLLHAAISAEENETAPLVRKAWQQTGLAPQLTPVMLERYITAEPELKQILLPDAEDVPLLAKKEIAAQTEQKKTLPGTETGDEPVNPSVKKQEETPAPKKPRVKKKKEEPVTEEKTISFPGETEEEAALKTNIENTLPEEGIYIEHAGLILLHPFFKFMMRATGLVKDNAFVNRTEQQRALYLLHFLATGTVEAEEHQLAMPKIICGWPLDEPVLTGLEIGASLQNEANDLLLAAIAQWTILKSTSPDGLREAFLQRAGKAVNGPNGLVIQVEKNSIDLLLDHLPWNLSLIKLPWLEALIRVEWR